MFIMRINRIKALVVLFGAIFICFVWSGLYFIVQGEREREIANAFKEAGNYARTFEEHMVQTLKGLDQIALFLKYQVENKSLQLDLQRLVNEGRFSGQPFIVLAVIDRNGEVVASSQKLVARVNNNDLEVFQAHKAVDTGKLFIGKPVLGRATGQWLIQMSRRINMTDGSFGGAVVVGVDPYYFAHFYTQVDLGENSVITLVGRDGIVRVRQSGNEVSMGLDFRQRVENEFSRGDVGQYIDSAIADGVKRYFSFRNLSEYPLTVVVGASEAQVFKNLDRRVAAYYWAGVALSGLIFLFVSLLLRSIGRREQIELDLRKSEAIKRSYFEQAPYGIFVANTKGEYLEVNPKACELSCYPAEELSQKSIPDLLLEEDVEKGIKDFAKLKESGTAGGNYRYRQKDGTIRWWSVAAVKISDDRLLGFCDDITDRKRAEDALQESEQRYRLLMMQAYDAIILFDLETLEIVEANSAFEKMTGYRFPLAKPLHVFELMADEPVNVMRYLDEMHTNGILHPTLRKIHTRDGGTRMVERTGNRLHIGDRQYQLTTFRDMTQERKLNQEMHKDLLLAAQVQRALLPVIPRSDCFLVTTVFKPQGFVSGDVYYLEWNEAEKILRGVLVDITGHGMATALQTAAVNVLLHQMADLPKQVNLLRRLDWLNNRIPPYIDEGTFAAAIIFEFDFSASQLCFVSAGINHFLHNGERIDVAGLYLGIRENEVYDLHRRPLRQGDAVCFMTDGISDIFDREKTWDSIEAGQVCRLFSEGDLAKKAQDDATAICIEIR